MQHPTGTRRQSWQAGLFRTRNECAARAEPSHQLPQDLPDNPTNPPTTGAGSAEQPNSPSDPFLQGLPDNPTKWTEMSKAMEGVSEETTTGVKRLYEMQVCGAVLTIVFSTTLSFLSCFRHLVHEKVAAYHPLSLPYLSWSHSVLEIITPAHAC